MCEKVERGFVDCDKCAEVDGVLLCGAQDGDEFFAEAAVAEEEGHSVGSVLALTNWEMRLRREVEKQPEENVHEGMWEANFCAVDEAIAKAFENCEHIVVFGVKEEGGDSLLEGGLC